MARRRAGAAPTSNLLVLRYLRVSALMGRSGDDFHSPDLQRDAIDRHVLPLGGTIVGEVCDIDVSGRSFSRDGIEEVREWAEAGRMNAIGLLNLSRLGRNVMESLTFISWLRDRGVTILSTKEQIDDSPAGQFMLTQFLAMAQLQADQIGQNWADLIEMRAGMGLHHGTPPLGYRWVDRRLVPDPVVGPAVTAAFKQYADRWPVSKILATLSQARGQRTARRTIKGTLSNPVYLGKVVLHGQTFDGLHEPLVDEATWELVAARLADDRSTPSRALQVTHALSGLLVCDLCDGRLGRQKALIKSHGRRIERVYCRRANSGGAEWRCPGIGTPRYEAIEAEALRQTYVYLDKLASTHEERAAALAKQESIAEAKTKSIHAELKATRTALARLAVLLAREQLTEAEHADASRELREDERRLQGELVQSRSIKVAPSQTEAAATSVALRQMWARALPAERNVLLRELIRQVRVSPGSAREVEERVDVRFWREPVSL